MPRLSLHLQDSQGRVGTAARSLRASRGVSNCVTGSKASPDLRAVLKPEQVPERGLAWRTEPAQLPGTYTLQVRVPPSRECQVPFASEIALLKKCHTVCGVTGPSK